MSADSAGPAISPTLIVGIVIAAAFAVMLIVASIFRFCHWNRSPVPNPDDDDEVDIFNPNRQRSEEQLIRMKEVRWINNMYAWERGRLAKMEVS
jgi:hypothetical protein